MSLHSYSFLLGGGLPEYGQRGWGREKALRWCHSWSYTSASGRLAPQQNGRQGGGL